MFCQLWRCRADKVIDRVSGISGNACAGGLQRNDGCRVGMTGDRGYRMVAVSIHTGSGYEGARRGYTCSGEIPAPELLGERRHTEKDRCPDCADNGIYHDLPVRNA